jgi:hypothetical protein
MPQSSGGSHDIRFSDDARLRRPVAVSRLAVAVSPCRRVAVQSTVAAKVMKRIVREARGSSFAVSTLRGGGSSRRLMLLFPQKVIVVVSRLQPWGWRVFEGTAKNSSGPPGAGTSQMGSWIV